MGVGAGGGELNAYALHKFMVWDNISAQRENHDPLTSVHISICIYTYICLLIW